MVHSNNWTKFVLSCSMAFTPGEVFNYCCGCSILLGGIIYSTTGMSADQFAELYLFHPLGITDYEWAKQPDGLPQTEGGLSLRPRDMLKFGLMFLNNGVWNNTRIISGEWILESTKKRLDYAEDLGYAYHWHRQTFRSKAWIVESIRANGWKGQFIYIFPSLDMVVVFTMYNDRWHTVAKQILNNYILPAVF